MADRPSISAARPEEAQELTSLAFRPKAHWGYSPEFMQDCRRELTVSPDRVESDRYRYFVAVDGNSTLGFCALECLSDGDCERDTLFVEPAWIGSGGRACPDQACQTDGVADRRDETDHPGKPRRSGLLPRLGDTLSR